MKLLGLFLAISLFSIVSSALQGECPSEEDVYPCTCRTVGSSMISIRCHNIENDSNRLTQTMNKISQYHIDFLTISDSSLEEITEQTFPNMSVTSLRMFQCNIKTFHMFSGLDGLKYSLQYLSMERCNVGSWVWSSEAEFVQLKAFRISHPTGSFNASLMISYLPVDLESLSLKRCNIMTMGELKLRKLERLRYLDLSYNKLASVSRNAFPDPAEELISYNLRNNPITLLPDDAFRGMPNLTNIFLADTALTTLPYNVFKTAIENRIAERPLHIRAGGIALRCDCNAAWLNEENPGLDIEKPLDCATPEKWRGKDVQELTPEELCFVDELKETELA